MKNLIVIDTKAIQYMLMNDYLQSCEKFKYEGSLDKYIRTQLLYLKSLAWLNDKLPSDIIFADDEKPYWRYDALYKHNINYKGNRTRNYLKAELLNQIQTIFLEQSVKTNNHILSYFDNDKNIGYEADDVAARLVKTHSLKYATTYLLTVDKDWLPLTSVKNVIWLNAKCSYLTPRSMNNNEALRYFQTAKEYNSTVEKLNFDKSCITDLWRFKAIFGDYSDSLPPQKGKNFVDLISYIDLFNPPEQHKLWLNADFQKYTTKVFDRTTPQKPISYEVFLNKTGITPFMTPIQVQESLPIAA